MKKTTYVALPKWNLRDNLSEFMRNQTKLRYELNGVKVVGTVVAAKVKDGKVFFATSNQPDNFRYRGGKGWERVEEVEVSLDERIETFVEDAGLSSEGEEAFRDIVAALRGGCNN